MQLIRPLAALVLAALAAPSFADEREGPRRASANQPGLFRASDYPAAARRAREEGDVTYRIEVGANGRVVGCSILASSGSAALDAQTCRLLQERARFARALDSEGRPVSDILSGRMRWRLP